MGATSLGILFYLAFLKMMITMDAMKEQNRPSILDRLSTLSAIILLAYAVTPFVDIPAINTSVNFLGILLVFHFDFSTYISILVPALAGVGMYWLIGTHPARKEDQYPLQHSILPALTAWVIGLPLSQFQNIGQKWIVFSLGGILLIIVFVAEYSVVDLHSERHSIAAGVLKALSLALYLLLAIAVRSAGLRLYLILPALGVAAFLVLLRTLYLQSGGKWLIGWSIGISGVIGQLVIAFHYLPIPPLSYGLFLIAPLYTLTDLAITYLEENSWKHALAGPIVMMCILLLLGFILG